MTNLLVEGGAEILGSFVAADAVDEFHVYIAPCIVGGSSAPGPVAGVGVDRMKDAWRLVEWEVLQPGGDVLLHGWRRVPAVNQD
jgi:diaminohydroxyphosphoribosylaminopyrimidine deaminase/5-amino-6-(5-phosphoribosylamino)uracil reductase